MKGVGWNTAWGSGLHLLSLLGRKKVSSVFLGYPPGLRIKLTWDRWTGEKSNKNFNNTYPWVKDMYTGRTNAEAQAQAPILWPSDVKNWRIGKDPDAGKNWRQEEKGMTEDEMVGWHHWLNGHEFEQTLGDSEEQKSLACCSPWGHKELDVTEQLNWTDTWVRDFPGGVNGKEPACQCRRH